MDSLGVGGSTVIGGHIWDPSLPQFQEWDRFRVPVRGTRYPWAWWRGDILMGSGTPNHVNDPEISGVWRPKDRDHYWEDDPAGNIACVGQYKESKGEYGIFVDQVTELRGLYESGTVSAQVMLTATRHLTPSEITAPRALNEIEDSLLVPLLALQTSGKVKITDFTSLIEDWKTVFGSQAFIYDANQPVGVSNRVGASPGQFNLFQNHPNPFNPSTEIRFDVKEPCIVTLKVMDMLGREIAMVENARYNPGRHSVRFDASSLPSGIYVYRIWMGNYTASRKMILSR
jgi:hypothetical protein